jgi:hypothetical protein
MASFFIIFPNFRQESNSVMMEYRPSPAKSCYQNATVADYLPRDFRESAAAFRFSDWSAFVLPLGSLAERQQPACHTPCRRMQLDIG